jgi:hypothetical protein
MDSAEAHRIGEKLCNFIENSLLKLAEDEGINIDIGCDICPFAEYCEYGCTGTTAWLLEESKED